jgi:hypothetical protein
VNREESLNRVADRMAPWYEDQGYSLPRFRIAIGFPSTGKRGKRIGECWDGLASADGTFEVLIRPDQSDPIEVAATLGALKAEPADPFPDLATVSVYGKRRIGRARSRAPRGAPAGPTPTGATRRPALSARPGRRGGLLAACYRSAPLALTRVGVGRCVEGRPESSSPRPKAAPFKRNDSLLDTLPIGVLHFPGTGIQDNLADKAKKLGIPVWKFGGA